MFHTPQAQRLASWLSCHWFFLFSLFFGIFVFAPFLAPVFIEAGWHKAGEAVYFIYSFFCHQLPERSFFLFGTKSMYPISEIQAAWKMSNDPLVMRKFIGNPEMGWKVAWSDRMVSMYVSTWLLALVWRPLRRKWKPLPIWAFVLLLVPMGLDGGSHFLSDLWGIGLGFRYNNAWLANLTNQVLPPSFYYGDALGSFNSWMRLTTGILFGLAVVGFGFPYIQAVFDDPHHNGGGNSQVLEGSQEAKSAKPTW
jgi:uncharacterized membrane protein